MRWFMLLLLGCPRPDPEPVPEDLAATLPAPGPHGVGYRESEITYDPGDGARVLRLAIWYPSPTDGGDEFRYQEIFPAPGVFPETDPAAGPFPLLVYSHGHQGYAEASGRLMRHLASHGYVIASPDHTGNTFLDGSDRPTEIYWQRATDISATIDHMRGTDPLSSSLTDAPIVAMGHSFGGYTCHALGGARYDSPGIFDDCEDGTDTSDFCSTMSSGNRAQFEAGLRDPRIAAIATMAPGNHALFGVAGLQQVDIPTLLMTGGLDSAEQAQLNWAGLDQPGNVHVRITDAGHNAFSDFGPALDVGEEFIDSEEGWATMGAYLLAWVRLQQGDDTLAPVLDGQVVFGDTTEVESGG